MTFSVNYYADIVGRKLMLVSLGTKRVEITLILECHRTRQPRLSKIDNFLAIREKYETFQTSYVCTPFFLFLACTWDILRITYTYPSPDTMIRWGYVFGRFKQLWRILENLLQMPLYFKPLECRPN